MKITKRLAAILAVVLLVGCTGLFESKTCGIKNTQWDRMTSMEQLDVQKAFNEKQRLADQMKLNKLAAKQQKELAKTRRANEKVQARRLDKEREEIKKQQSQIKTDLELKKQAYVHPEVSTEVTTQVGTEFVTQIGTEVITDAPVQN